MAEEPERPSEESAAAARIAHQSQWVEQQLRRAVERGDFDDLPGYGKPIEGLGTSHDPDWWVRKLVEREQITLLPPALAIRQEDAGLDDRLDRITTEDGVRRAVAEFNAAVRRALYTPPTGPTAPPMVTRPRDPDTEVRRWVERRDARLAAQREALRVAEAGEVARGRRRRWRPGGRRRRSGPDRPA